MDINKGIKLHLERTVNPINSGLEVYNSENRIPASIKIDYTGNRPSSIYCEISNGENFIEIWFNKETKKLYEITIVAVQEDTVKVVDNDKIVEEDFYNCFITDDSILEISQPITVLRSNNSLCFFWGNQPSQTYSIAKNCIIGTDNEKDLCSIFLVNLNNELIYEILGF